MNAELQIKESDKRQEEQSNAASRAAQAIHTGGERILSLVAGLPGAAMRRVRTLHRQTRRLVREKRAKRFPESQRRVVQLFLFAWGMLPMLGGTLREKTWGLRKKSINAYAHLRAGLERRKIHPALFLSSAAVVAVVAVLSSLYTFGTTVKFDGSVIASVRSLNTVEDACTNLERITARTLGSAYTIDENRIQYTSGFISRSALVDEATLEEELSDQLGLVTYGYSLYLDGELIGATTYEGALEELLQQIRDAYTDENTVSCEIIEDIQVRPEYVPTDKVMNLGYIAELLNSTKAGEVTYTVVKGDTWSEIAERYDMTSKELLAMNPGYDINKIAIGDVLTISNAVPYLTVSQVQQERYVEDIPYDIEYQDSAYLYQGDYKVLSAGSYGSADVVANVTYVNGEETQRDVLSSVTLVNPTTEVQARGTLERPTWVATGSFRWPCSGRITSRYGYRNLSYAKASKNHKGIDIANGYGTAVCAADGGTVTYAGWMSGYGYLVQVDHGNGYVTYYGHNSSLLVSVGDHVYKGQQVARMGSTGNSTGNHCHFEIRYKGTPKNPMNYLP
ncbi:peptidoglycan DD-metalloendopeptidase family protein [Oscillibacter sp. MSJ-2]|uniref:Peptidoglycan DD-metalloendopeptidase family protein n=1 Tax=Dysosmobacter acutus TaxID=2841504 RepID=A0ABS6F6F6_9FIRM|nr:peptidoglycan DD-metalloendopeptidase family protein [Dysosmobacter acutus]MBU5625836.1 peptidoglycan DD-metalloendopeptidase family protein [Dysosmobacter acutus]